MTPGWLASHAVTRLVERAAWALVVGGALLVVAPARIPRDEGRAQAAVSGVVPAPVRATTGASWLNANPFAASRRAPLRRWVPNDTASVAPDTLGSAAEPEVPRLFGTMVGGTGSSALLRLEAGRPAARLYMVGERGGAYTVRRILEDVVILDGPSGRVELRLRRGEARP